MKTLCTTLVLLLTLNMVHAQSVFETRVREIRKEIQKITEAEKDKLRNEVVSINNRWDNGEISSEEATRLKNEAAEKSARIIEERIAPLEKEIQELVKSQAEGALENEYDYEELTIGNVKIEFRPKKRYKDKYPRSQRRTQTMPVLAFGINNVITDGDLGSLNDSEFHVMRSRFFEWGLTGKTRIFAESNLLHIRYGFSFMYNRLRPLDNQYFVKDGNQTVLEIFPQTMSRDARYRNVQLVLPVHLEFDFTRKRTYNDRPIYRIQRSFRTGIGAYAGINTRSSQTIHYRENGQDVRTRVRGDFNVNQFIYGTSAYIGYRDVSLYVKYDLNPMFKSNVPEQNNISIGVRFDLN